MALDSKGDGSGRKLIGKGAIDFLIYTAESGERSIDARYGDEKVWLSQKLIAELFNVNVRMDSKRLSNIFRSEELQRKTVIRKFRITADNGEAYLTRHWNLNAIISVGYRVNLVRAKHFRQ